MDGITHVMPVGHTKETLVESLRLFPVSKIILLLSTKSDLESEETARVIAKQIRSEIGTIPCEEVYLDADNISSSALKIIDLIKKEKEQDRRVMINLSGSLRSMTLSGYIAASVTNSESYIGVPDYKDGKVIGISGVVQVPLLPTQIFSVEKTEILKSLTDSELGFDEIIEKIKPDVTKNGPSYLNEKSRLSHHIKDLREDGFVESIRDGKRTKLKLSDLGAIYCRGKA